MRVYYCENDNVAASCNTIRRVQSDRIVVIMTTTSRAVQWIAHFYRWGSLGVLNSVSRGVAIFNASQSFLDC